MTPQAILADVNLDDEIARFPPEGVSGRRAETLLKTPHLRVVLITMRAGAELNEHSAPGPIVVQPLRGRFTFRANDDAWELAPGALLSVAGGVRHTVRASEDGAFLLTISWPGEAAESGQAHDGALGG